MGFFEEHMADGRVRRGETFTCAHCNSVVECKDNMGMLKPPTMCAMEHKPLCERCAKRADARTDGMCEVFEKQMEKIEARDRLLRAVGVGQ